MKSGSMAMMKRVAMSNEKMRAAREVQPKHSRGPWTVDTDCGFPWHIREPQGDTVCRIGGHETSVVDEDKCEFNARLICAATDLLEALTNLLRETSNGTDICAAKFVSAAKTAIEKATIIPA